MCSRWDMSSSATIALDLLACAVGMIKGDWQIASPMNFERKGIWQQGVLLNGEPLQGWTMRPGLAGEQLALASASGSVPWQPAKNGDRCAGTGRRFPCLSLCSAARRYFAWMLMAWARACSGSMASVSGVTGFSTHQVPRVKPPSATITYLLTGSGLATRSWCSKSKRLSRTRSSLRCARKGFGAAQLARPTVASRVGRSFSIGDLSPP